MLKMRIIKVASLLIIVFLSYTFKASGENILTLKNDSLNKSELRINIPTQVFFKDNEYKRKIAYGYTLGGFRIKPNIEYRLNKTLTFKIGVNALRYWGADKYGAYNFVSVPYYSDTNTQKQIHIKPYLQAVYRPNENISFIMGNLNHQDCHYLNSPMYNSELVYSADDEEGMQLIYNGKYLNMDIWFNLQNFNFFNDVDRESLLVGVSGYSKFEFLKTNELRVNYAFLWQHHGGELDTLDLPLDHWTNFRLGADCYKYFNSNYLKHISIGFDYYYAKALRNPTWYFSSGYAYYPHISVQTTNIQCNIGYFYSKDFTSLYGNAFYSNVAQRNKSIYYPENKMITMDLSYKINLSNKHNLYLFGEFYYKLDDCNSIEKENKSLSMALGIKLSMDNSFHLTNISF